MQSRYRFLSVIVFMTLLSASATQAINWRARLTQAALVATAVLPFATQAGAAYLCHQYTGVMPSEGGSAVFTCTGSWSWVGRNDYPHSYQASLFNSSNIATLTLDELKTYPLQCFTTQVMATLVRDKNGHSIRQPVLLTSLQAGDVILDKNNEETTVLGFLHRESGLRKHPKVRTFFTKHNGVEIPIVEVTAKHYLYDAQGNPKLAETFQAGDSFLAADGTSYRISRTHTRRTRGIVVPMTASGHFMAHMDARGENTGILASCYAHVHPSIAHPYERLKFGIWGQGADDRAKPSDLERGLFNAMHKLGLAD